MFDLVLASSNGHGGLYTWHREDLNLTQVTLFPRAPLPSLPIPIRIPNRLSDHAILRDNLEILWEPGISSIQGSYAIDPQVGAQLVNLVFTALWIRLRGLINRASRILQMGIFYEYSLAGAKTTGSSHPIFSPATLFPRHPCLNQESPNTVSWDLGMGPKMRQSVVW